MGGVSVNCLVGKGWLFALSVNRHSVKVNSNQKEVTLGYSSSHSSTHACGLEQTPNTFSTARDIHCISAETLKTAFITNITEVQQLIYCVVSYIGTTEFSFVCVQHLVGTDTGNAMPSLQVTTGAGQTSL